MQVEVVDWRAEDGFGVIASVDLLEVQDEQVELAGRLSASTGNPDLALHHHLPLNLELVSELSRWIWTLHAQDQELAFRGRLAVADLGSTLDLWLGTERHRRLCLRLRILRTEAEEQQQWQSFFSGQASTLPSAELGRIANTALGAVHVMSSASKPPALAYFCDHAASEQLVVEAARLRHRGRFPSVLGVDDGTVLASRLVLNWNLLLIQEGEQRFLVFQGVSSSDAILLPGLNLMVLVCHLDAQRVGDCLRILCRTPEFLMATTPATFGGFLVGHSRPYHCLYDSLLGLQSVLEAGELGTGDALYSKADEAFVDLSAALGLGMTHQRHSLEQLNALSQNQGCYLLQLGFLFHTRADQPAMRRLAAAVDGPLRELALSSSELAAHGHLEALQRCRPLLWVGITGQKRSWLEQVEGTAALLNALHELFPSMGVVFDGWTPPLVTSDYHRREARRDDRVIQRIIRKLHFRSRGRVAVIAGLPLLEKVRVGLAVDAFLANYTTGSLNVARICGKPGVGHMGRRMMAAKQQHIHHKTREIDPGLVQDRSDSSTPTGYVNYSLPWQALYNVLVEVLTEQGFPACRPLTPLPIPESASTHG